MCCKGQECKGEKQERKQPLKQGPREKGINIYGAPTMYQALH